MINIEISLGLVLRNLRLPPKTGNVKSEKSLGKIGTNVCKKRV